jgi:hypothetical protein
MVTYIRSASVNGAENQQRAMEFAKKIGHYVDGKFGFSKLKVGLEVYGNVGRIYWMGEQENLETLARGAVQSLTDPGYLKVVAEGTGLFVAGSLHDTVILGI